MAIDHLLVCPALYFGGGRLAERARPGVVLASGPAFRATVLVGCNIGIGIVEIAPPDQGILGGAQRSRAKESATCALQKGESALRSASDEWVRWGLSSIFRAEL